MTTPRIFRKVFAENIQLSNDESTHIFTVLRRRSGDAAEVVFEAEGAVYLGVLNAESTTIHSLQLLEQRMSSQIEIHLAIPLLKSGGVEQVIDYATELGAASLHVFEAEKSVVKFADKAEAKKLRFQACALSAAAQCKRLSVPEIYTYSNLVELLAANKEKKVICCALGSTLAVIGNDFSGKPPMIIAGPEGDFSEGEMKSLQEATDTFVSLGSNVLRATLAPIAALIQIQVQSSIPYVMTHGRQWL